VGLFVSIVLAAALVLADDGWRALHATHITLAALISMAFATPIQRDAGERVAPDWRVGVVMVAGTVISLFLAPVVSPAIMQEDLMVHQIGPVENRRQLVLGGREMTGFIVIPDTEPRPLEFEAVSFAEFRKLFMNRPIHLDPASFLQSLEKQVPFAFVW